MKASVNRLKMCKNKVSFTSKQAALKVAEKHNQRVYECPVCFCYHCTKLEDWKSLFVPVEEYESLERRCKIQKKKIERVGKLNYDLQTRINVLKSELKELRHGRKKD